MLVIFLNSDSAITSSPVKLLVRLENTDAADRHGFLCHELTEVKDEFRYLLKCPFCSEPRKTVVQKYIWTNPNIPKFKKLMIMNPSKQLIKLCPNRTSWKPISRYTATLCY